jgi:hypothetical protein
MNDLYEAADVIDPNLLATIPTAGPVDPFTRARLRSLLAEHFDSTPAIDRHLDLLDTRGAWYAERAMTSWPHNQPDSFFGVVHYVVRAQLPGPAPQPDLDAWLIAGRPADPRLASRWNTIRALAIQGGSRVPDLDRGSAGCDSGAIAVAERLDDLLADWPDELLERFLLAYVKLPIVLRRKRFTLPPVGR